MTYEVPLVIKKKISIVVIGNTGSEPYILRTLLEGFNYHVEVHWVGSRKELIEILQGNIPTYDHVVLSCHGDEADGGSILVPDEPPLTTVDILTTTRWSNKTLLNLGCSTGTPALAQAFPHSG